MMDLHRLRLLRELHARGTVAAVADALSYSPSTVSHQLGQLQREAGVPLFVRDGRLLQLTEAAQVLVRHAEVLLAQMERAEAEMAAADGAVTGTVRIAAFQTAVISLVAPVLAELSGRHPGLRVEVTQTEPDHALAALRQREFDIAVCDEYDAYPRPRLGGLTCDDLYVERIHLVLPRNHPAKRLRDLADACWAGGHPATSHERLVLQACAAHGGFQPDIRHRATDLLVLLALVAAGQAVTLLPNLAHPRRDHAVDVRDTGVSRRVFTAVRDSALARPALDTVRAALRATARGITEPADRLLGRGGDRDVSRS